MDFKKNQKIGEGNQIGKFEEFVSIASNFESKFKDQLQDVPKIVVSLQSFINDMKKEIKEFEKIATDFEKLIILYVNLVMCTKHNLNMIKPLLKDSVIHLRVLEDASSTKVMNQNDKADCNKALDKLSEVFTELERKSENASNESRDLDKKIEELKKQCDDKQNIVRERSKKNPELEFTIGQFLSGIGFVVAGVVVSPLVVASSCLGAVIVSISSMIGYLWDTHQKNALKYLDKILSHLQKLQKANTLFMEYMDKSKEKNNELFISMNSIKENVINGSERYRKFCSEESNKASESTNNFIKMIENIDKIDITSWCSSSIKN